MTRETGSATGHPARCGMRSISALAILFIMSQTTGGTTVGRYDDFARCLTEKHAVMYGSFLCPHCREQKELFGGSFAYIRYVECSVLGSREPAPACKAAQIKHVPTWVFADGRRREGLTPLLELSERTGCKLP